MRDRVFEFLPVLLVAVVLIGYQLYRTAPVPATAQSPAMQPLATAPAVATRPPRPLVGTARTPAPAEDCSGGQPRFVGGFALLRAAVGSRMGDALDCEHLVDSLGDTQQTTTTGLAYYLKDINAPCFTTGFEHWALTAEGSLVRWTGDSTIPPPR